MKSVNRFIHNVRFDSNIPEVDVISIILVGHLLYEYLDK